MRNALCITLSPPMPESKNATLNAIASQMFCLDYITIAGAR